LKTGHRARRLLVVKEAALMVIVTDGRLPAPSDANTVPGTSMPVAVAPLRSMVAAKVMGVVVRRSSRWS
jgi:hypothetical protein